MCGFFWNVRSYLIVVLNINSSDLVFSTLTDGGSQAKSSLTLPALAAGECDMKLPLCKTDSLLLIGRETGLTTMVRQGQDLPQ